MLRSSGTSRPDGNAESIRRDWSEYDRPSTAIVETVATVLDQEWDDLPPLQNFVDVDALDTLLTRERPTDKAIRVSFAYGALTVTVKSTGTIEIQ